MKALLADAARCLSVGWGEYRDRVVGVACTVWLEDYERARVLLPRLKDKEPEALCVDCCVEPALQLLPQAPEGEGILGKLGKVELFFDQGESFHHKIRRMWDGPRAKRSTALSLVQNIELAGMQDTPPLQAADYLAWHTNRHLVGKKLVAGVQRVLSAPWWGSNSTTRSWSSGSRQASSHNLVCADGRFTANSPNQVTTDRAQKQPQTARCTSKTNDAV